MRADRGRRAELFGRVLERLRSILGSLCFFGRIGPGAKEGVTRIPESNYDREARGPCLLCTQLYKPLSRLGVNEA